MAPPLKIRRTSDRWLLFSLAAFIVGFVLCVLLPYHRWPVLFYLAAIAGAVKYHGTCCCETRENAEKSDSIEQDPEEGVK